MSNSRRAICFLVIASLTSCAPPTSFPPPIPSPDWNWTIALVKSGGFAGVDLRVRAESTGELGASDVHSGREVRKPLSASDVRELEALLAVLSLRRPGGAPSACADCFLYDLEITSRGRTSYWRGDDTTLEASGAADLIRLLERLRDAALSSAN